MRRRGDVWEYRVRVDDRQISFFGRTQGEAQSRADEAKREQRFAASHAPTVRDWLAQWLEHRKSDLRPQTWYVYESQMRRHVLPVLGDVRLDALKAEHIDRLDAALSRTVGKTTAHHVRVTFSTALNDAAKRGIRVADAHRVVAKPRRDDPDIVPLTRDEVDRLVVACRDDQFEAAYILAVTLGMREGELLGLRWDDIDLERRRLVVRGNATRGFDGVRNVTAPKTRAGYRTLVLPSICRDALIRTHRLGALVWPARSGGPIWEGAFRRRWQAMCAKASIRPVTFHTLRHTAATLALEDGTPLHVVTATLGHTKPETTARLYAHLTHPSMVALADAIDVRFGARLRVLPETQ